MKANGMSQRYIRRRRASALQPAPSGCCGVVHGLLRSRLVSVAPTSADKRDAEQAASHARYRTAAQQSVKEFHARDEACGLMMTSGFVIDPDSILKTIWDILLTPIILYTATAMPYQIFFELEETSAWKALDMCATILFVADMVVEFNTAYYCDSTRAHVETNRFKIAWRYITTWFIFDLVAVLPGEWLFGVDQGGEGTKFAKLARISRTFRLLRAFRIFKMAASRTMRDAVMWLQHSLAISPMWNPLLRDFWVSALVIHMGAGLWHFVGLREMEAGHASWITRADMESSPAAERYVTSLYWTISTLTSVGYGDVAAETPSEELMSIAYMLLGVVGAGVIVADILTIKERMASVTKVQADRTAAVDRLIHRVSPPWALKVGLKNWVEEANSKLHETYDVLPQLPPALRRDVILHMRWEVAATVGLFQLPEISDELTADFLWFMKRVSVKGGEFVYMQHTPAEFMYFLMSGEVVIMKEKEREVEPKTAGGRERAREGILSRVNVEPMYALNRGDNFGDSDVLFSDRHTVSAFCSRNAELYAMERRHIEKLCQENSSLYFLLRQKARDDARKRRLQMPAAILAEVTAQADGTRTLAEDDAKQGTDEVRGTVSAIKAALQPPAQPTFTQRLRDTLTWSARSPGSVKPSMPETAVAVPEERGGGGEAPSTPAQSGEQARRVSGAEGEEEGTEDSPTTATGLSGWRKAIQWAQLRNLDVEAEEAAEEMAMDMGAVKTGRFGRMSDHQVANLPSVQRVAEVATKRVKARWKFAATAVLHGLQGNAAGAGAAKSPAEEAAQPAADEAAAAPAAAAQPAAQTRQREE